MRLLLLALFLNFNLIQIGAQTVSYQDLQLHSGLEGELLGTPNLAAPASLTKHVGLLMIVDSTTQEPQVNGTVSFVQKLAARLAAENIHKKKPNKAAKLLYETVHSDVLRKYDEDAQFPDLFNGGDYNCVTATALYALLLEELALPYEIRELPTHVYLVYDPGASDLVIESTDPVEGIFALDKAALVKELAEQKMISAADYRSKSVEQLYEEYVAEFERIIDIQGLASDLYYNAGVLALEHEKYALGTELLKKSVYLQSSEVKIEIWANSLLLQLEGMSLEDIESFSPLFALQHFPAYRDGALEDISSNYFQLSEDFLIAANRRVAYMEARAYFLENLLADAPLTREKLDLIHHGQLGRHFALLDQMDKSYVHFDSAYQLQPSHLNVQAALRDLVFRKISELMQAEDMEGLATFMRQESERHPFLREHARFHQLSIFSEFAPVIEAFENNQEDDALAAFAECEDKLVSLNDGSEAFKEVVGSLFGSASSYYFRITDGKSAKHWVEEGLKIVPDSEELLRKKNMLVDYYGE